jgi:hypothetical protein
MLEEAKHVTHLRRHHLHVLLTPLLTNWSSHGIGDILIAFRLLSIRCKVNIHSGCYFVCASISNISKPGENLTQCAISVCICVFEGTVLWH